MAAAGAKGAMYISSHSADVILSDIRPVKLDLDALSFLNAILDEILVNVIVAAHSLSTERLKAGLLRVLSTPLGKEALLEAELELRAYWERMKAPTAPVLSNGSPDNRFNAQWAVELLRLKCQAYSTLNDSDEDAQAERKLNERLGIHDVGPSSALVAPAALYMTAILECICEHILSNVGRVATRDSSRTVAGIPDLFTALCEDDSMYGLFRSLHVYDRVELLTKSNRPRRNKSISSQATHHDRTMSSNSEASPPATRRDVQFAQPNSADASGLSFSQSGRQTPPSRSSLEKVRSIKLFNKAHTRTSSDREIPVDGHGVVHRKSEAQAHDPARKSSVSGHSDALHEVASVSLEDERTQEFEDLVRSAGTMKMSLTPDRLRTMEDVKPARNAIGGIRPAPHIGATPTRDATSPSPSPAPARAASIRQKLSHGTIREDEEARDAAGAPSSYNPHKRKNEMPPPSTSGPIRSRSISTSGVYPSKPASTPFRQPFSSVHSTPQRGADPRSPPRSTDEFGMPKRTRKIQRNRESMDLDDVMNGSDDEGEEAAARPVRTPSTPSARKSPASNGQISQSARELIAFLDEGPPPEPYQSRPPPSVVSITSPTKSNGKGRLQRMISKLSLSADKELDGSPSRRTPSVSVPTTPSARSPPPLPVPAIPVPPRIIPATPVTLISPPESPIDEPSYDARSDRSRKISAPPRRAVPAWGSSNSPTPTSTPIQAPMPTPPSSRFTPRPSADKSGPSINGTGAGNGSAPVTPSLPTHSLPTPSPSQMNDLMNGRAARTADGQTAEQPRWSPSLVAERQYGAEAEPVMLAAAPPRKSISRRVEPEQQQSQPQQPQQQPTRKVLAEELAIDMRKMMGRATNADECRLLVDMFLARAGIGMHPPVEGAVVPDAQVQRSEQAPAPGTLELEIVELFLGGAEGKDESLPPTSHVPEEPVARKGPIEPNPQDAYHTPVPSPVIQRTADTHPRMMTVAVGA